MAQIGLTMSFYVLSKHDSRYVEILYREQLSICTTCFGLTSLGTSYQHCACEPEPKVNRPKDDCPNGYHLCHLCAQDVAGGTSRFAWVVCDECQIQCNSVPRAGRRIPIGRHSLMNGHLWPLDVSEEQSEAQANEVVAFAQSQMTLAEFGKLQAKQLFDSATQLHDLKVVPVTEWKRLFPTSVETSRWAISKFLLATGKKRKPAKRKKVAAIESKEV